VEDIEKPPFEIIDNTDDVSEPRPAAMINMRGGAQQRANKIARRSQIEDSMTDPYQ
jgi:hypothetical protein